MRPVTGSCGEPTKTEYPKETLEEFLAKCVLFCFVIGLAGAIFSIFALAGICASDRTNRTIDTPAEFVCLYILANSLMLIFCPIALSALVSLLAKSNDHDNEKARKLGRIQ